MHTGWASMWLPVADHLLNSSRNLCPSVLVLQMWRPLRDLRRDTTAWCAFVVACCGKLARFLRRNGRRAYIQCCLCPCPITIAMLISLTRFAALVEKNFTVTVRRRPTGIIFQGLILRLLVVLVISSSQVYGIGPATPVCPAWIGARSKLPIDPPRSSP